MQKSKSIAEYLHHHVQWNAELQTLISVLNETDLVAEIKWGAPTYTLNGKNVVGVAAFKEYVALWFHQGVFIEDTHNILIASNENTKGLRQIRFKNLEEIQQNLDAIQSFIASAIQNQRQGKVIQPSARIFEMPDVLQKALDSDFALADSFNQLSPYKQKEYKEYIGTAKQESTQITRLQKCLPLIAAGKGLNDKYR